MKADWKHLKRNLENETKKIMLEEPVDVKRLYEGIFPYDVGVGGQYFTAQCFVWSSVQGLGFTYVSHGILRALEDPDFSVEQCKKLFKYMHVMNDFLGYAGLEKLYSFTKELLKAFDSIKTKEELEELMVAYFKYTGRLYGWVHQRFPWGLGYVYRTKDPKDIEEKMKDLRKMRKLYEKPVGKE
jgi:hypothetical protein